MQGRNLVIRIKRGEIRCPQGFLASEARFQPLPVSPAKFRAIVSNSQNYNYHENYRFSIAFIIFSGMMTQQRAKLEFLQETNHQK
jgi:hypothetical protein